MLLDDSGRNENAPVAAFDGLPNVGTKIFEKMLEIFKIFGQGYNAFVGNFANGNFINQFAVTVKMKVDIIGKNQVV